MPDMPTRKRKAPITAGNELDTATAPPSPKENDSSSPPPEVPLSASEAALASQHKSRLLFISSHPELYANIDLDADTVHVLLKTSFFKDVSAKDCRTPAQSKAKTKSSGSKTDNKRKGKARRKRSS
ncbi:uncharacterized protein EHS24_000081 [Apiotrichum porosum]|uniref:Uncharacterized protein n=1 Tax=Apiotrichum porosum TaxID=105984 RepID=A0A427Y8Y6_9TREE|nr:uncharacterized protein EHS24_000081 [Apiotrichum porosum]RSH87571.1 hypothetical protein EHS24_000081 [Apiotrichum porosum]